jgi:hypothetical protein
MTPRAQIAVTADALRAAVASQAFGEAERLLSDYCRQVETVIRREPGAAENTQLAADSVSLFEWMRRSVLADAAHLAGRLASIPPRHAYRQISSQTPSWRVDG